MEERAYDEGVMKKAGKILADERLKAFEEMNGEEKVFSRRFERKKEKLFRRAAGTGTRGRVTGRRALRIIAVCAASVVLMTVSVMAVPPVREAFDGFRTRIFAEFVGENRMTMTVESDGGAFVIVGSEPTYIPEGYEMTYEEQYGDGPASMYMANYTRASTNPAKKYTGIVFERTNIEGINYTSDQHYGHVEMSTETVRIGAYEGQKLTLRTNGGPDPDLWSEDTKFVWSDTRYLYELWAITAVSEKSELIPLPCEKLLRMAESVSHDAVAAADESVLFGFIPDEEGERVTEGICPRCGKAEIEAVCSHDAVLNSAGEPMIDMIPWDIGRDGVKIEVIRAAGMCYTDHVCPNCRYTVSGAWDDRHVEWVKDEAGEKIPVCPYRDE